MTQNRSNKSDFDKNLNDLEKRYGADKTKSKKADALANSNASKMINIAFQVLSEMVAGIAVGAVMGYGLGMLVGGKMVCLALGSLLGFLSGIFNVWRLINRTTF